MSAKRARSDSVSDGPSAKKLRPHVELRRDAVAHEAKAVDRFVHSAPADVDLTTLLLDEMIMVIVRQEEYGAAQQRGICVLADAHPGEQDIMNAEAIRFPLARLLGQCSRRLRGIMARTMPECISLAGHASPSPIWLAWYAWLAGTRHLQANYFTVLKGSDFYGRPGAPMIFRNLHYQGSGTGQLAKRHTIFGKGGATQTAKIVHPLRGGLTVPVLLQAAALYYRHETNARLFLHEATWMSRTGKYDDILRGFFLLRGISRDGAVNDFLQMFDDRRRTIAGAILCAHSADELDRLPWPDTISRYEWEAWAIFACSNGDIGIMAAVWARKVPREEDEGFDMDEEHLFEETVWYRLMASPRGADSLAAHAWLHERVPFPAKPPDEPGSDRRNAFCIQTATSIAWCYHHWRGIDVSIVSFDCPTALGRLLALAREDADIKIADAAFFTRESDCNDTRFTVAQMPPADVTALMAHAPFTEKMLDWIRNGLPSVRSEATVRQLIAALYGADPCVDEMVGHIADYYFAGRPFEPAIRAMFDHLIATAKTPEQGKRSVHAALRFMAGCGTASGHDTLDVVPKAVDYYRALV